MKVSLIATIYNEEESIDEFIRSIIKQSKKPSEIIFVDAESSDNTRKIIKQYKEIKLFTRKGNRSVGRNYGISKAHGEIIVVSDAGCVLDKNYIRNITSPFKKRTIDVVSGFYYPITNNVFEKSLAAYTCTMVDKVDKKNYLPSSRSIAFKKIVWESVGGYPEELDTCEDLIFARNLLMGKYSSMFTEKAFVWWKQRKNLKEAWMQFYNYAKGDGKAMYIRPQAPFLFIRYVVAVIVALYYFTSGSVIIGHVLIGLGTMYFLWSIIKNYKYVNHVKAIYYLPALQLAADSAVILGMTMGYFQRVKPIK